MDTQSLLTFVDIAASRSFSRSAEHLHLSQPAVSKRIASLEQQLGQPLLDRVGRKVLLTEAGEALLPYARQVLGTLEDARRRLSHLHAAVSGRLSVGTSHHIGLHRLPPVLRRYTQQYPDVDLDIHFMDSEQACDAVLAGELEMAVVTLPPEAPPALAITPLWPDPLDVMIGPDHPLGGRKAVRLDELAAYPAVLPDEQTYTHRIISEALAASQRPLRIRLATNYLETLRMLVGIGMGWSVLPRSMAGPDLIRLPVADLAMQRELGLVRHRERAESAAAQQFARLASEIASS